MSLMQYSPRLAGSNLRGCRALAATGTYTACMGLQRLVLAATLLGTGVVAWAQEVGDPTPEEQYFICLINRARANPAGEAKRLGIDLNEGLPAGKISDKPKQPLAHHPKLASAARGHSRWMLEEDTISHEGAGESSPQRRMEEAGYRFTPPCGSGENLGFVGQTQDYKPAVDAMDDLYRGLFIDEGVEGRGHRTNLLAEPFRETGVGVAKGLLANAGRQFNSWVVTQNFAYNPGNPFLVGVVFADTVTRDEFYTPGEGKGGVTITAQRKGGTARFTAKTWASGGYVLQLPPGTYQVTAAGGGLTKAVDGGTVTIGKVNAAADFAITGQ